MDDLGVPPFQETSIWTMAESPSSIFVLGSVQVIWVPRDPLASTCHISISAPPKCWSNSWELKNTSSVSRWSHLLCGSVWYINGSWSWIKCWLRCSPRTPMQSRKHLFEIYKSVQQFCTFFPCYQCRLLSVEWGGVRSAGCHLPIFFKDRVWNAQKRWNYKISERNLPRKTSKTPSIWACSDSARKPGAIPNSKVAWKM